MDSIILPSKEMYSVVRDDLVCIDHVSLMLSNESVLALASILDGIGVCHTLLNKEGLPRQTAVTIVYSKNRLPKYLIKEDLEVDATFVPLVKPEQYDTFINSGNLKFQTVTDIHGNKMDVILIKTNTFMSLHEKYINDYNAEWSQGEYMPFIKINSPSYYDGSDWFNTLSMPETNQVLTFTDVRYMRFGERI